MRLIVSLLAAAACLAPGALAAVPVHSGGAVDGFNPSDLDRGVLPGQNFFEFANGGWIKTNPVPPDRTHWSALSSLRELNRERIHRILQQAAAETNAVPGSIAQKIGDFYVSGMDVNAINAARLKPLASEFRRINAIHNLDGLQAEVARLQKMGVNVLFKFGKMQDFKDSTQVIGYADQGGLGMPRRADYIKDSAAAQKLRHEYVTHVARMLELYGTDTEQARHNAQRILQIETVLAKASMSRAERRDPRAIYHPTSLKELGQLTPDFPWQRYFILMGHPEIQNINVTHPDFFAALDRELKHAPIADWKSYLRWHLLKATAPYLSQPFVKEHFRFRALLTGRTQIPPRWQRVAAAEDRVLGFAVGQVFIERYFSAAARQRINEMLDNIESALRDEIITLDWMSVETKKQALVKLSLVTEKIGYPEEWPDYSGLMINRGPYVLNVLRANVFKTERELLTIGRPLDRKRWEMPPQTTRAYYDPSMNEIVLPAGILQPPFFDAKAPPAINYGAAGALMGRELLRGFDLKGSHYDSRGNLRDWWTRTDLEHYNANERCIAAQLPKRGGGVEPAITGRQIAGFTRELGGLRLAELAYRDSEAARQTHPIGGFSADQLFFLGFAHTWAESAAGYAAKESHLTARERVNGIVANLPAFRQAFDLKNESPMVNPHACKIW